MAYSNHSHSQYLTLYVHQWADLHPHLMTGLKRLAVVLGAGALLAFAVALATDQAMTFPMNAAEVVHMAGNSDMAGARVVNYFPEQFFKEAQRAEIQELPPQF